MIVRYRLALRNLKVNNKMLHFKRYFPGVAAVAIYGARQI